MGIFGNSGGLNETAVLEALKAVKDPDLQQDVVTLGFVKDLKIAAGNVSFSLELTTPACPVKDQLRAEAERAVSSLPGVQRVDVRMTFRVTTTQTQQARTLIPEVRNTIAVASGKGGVGKSTVAANLAVALMKFGAKVGLMDADVYGPSIPILMGASEPPQVTQNRIIPPVAQGVKMISMGYFLPKNEAVIWRGPMLHKMIQQFLGEVEWGELDYLVIDLPPGTGDVALSLIQTAAITGAIVVTTPSDVSLEDARKAINMFGQVRVPILGIVENMSYLIAPGSGERIDVFGQGGGKRTAEQMKVPFLGELALNPQVRIGGDTGAPVSTRAEVDEHSSPFLELAQRVDEACAGMKSGVPRITVED